MPTAVQPEHVREQPAQHLLGRVRGARPPCRRTAPGAGSARRSSFPFTVSGSASSTTNADGTMYSGSRSARMTAPRGRPAPARRAADHVSRPAACPRAGPPGTITAACATPGWAGQHRLDLARLDPEPPDLHLVVGAADEHQLPVRVSTGPGHRSGTSAHPAARTDRPRTGPPSAPAGPGIPAPAPPRRCTAHQARPGGTSPSHSFST